MRYYNGEKNNVVISYAVSLAEDAIMFSNKPGLVSPHFICPDCHYSFETE
jgi:hypothetical protein